MLVALLRTVKGALTSAAGAALVSSFMLSRPCSAQPAMVATEFEVKAAFLLNFPKFVEWPPEQADKEITLCIIGVDPFGDVIDKLASTQRPPPPIYRVKSIDDHSQCKVLFISSSEQARVEKILEKERNRPVLTVSDIPEFISHNGMIGLMVEEGKVRFEINTSEASRSGLSVSSKLLNLAKNRPE